MAKLIQEGEENFILRMYLSMTESKLLLSGSKVECYED